uniref:Uncharacterized protein n=1 Tax=Rhizophora mucronata TaxID=61149 RepID=A0A2P2NAM4_RHIMU
MSWGQQSLTRHLPTNKHKPSMENGQA